MMERKLRFHIRWVSIEPLKGRQFPMANFQLKKPFVSVCRHGGIDIDRRSQHHRQQLNGLEMFGIGTEFTSATKINSFNSEHLNPIILSTFIPPKKQKSSDFCLEPLSW